MGAASEAVDSKNFSKVAKELSEKVMGKGS